MSIDFPEFYFRLRDNGAAVFRVGADDRSRRMEMKQIATVVLRNGKIKPQGDHVLPEYEEQAILNWMKEREALQSRRDLDDIFRTIDHLNLTTQWLQSKATSEQVLEVADHLLLSMHDLRGLLVRAKADAVDAQRKDKSTP